LSKSFVVDKNATALKPKHPHNKIIIAARTKEELVPLTKVHPMQKVFVSTSGINYGKREQVYVKWTSPSDSVYKQLFTYESHCSVSWIPKPGSLPLELGQWKVKVENLNGTVYLSSKFTVNYKAKLIN